MHFGKVVLAKGEKMKEHSNGQFEELLVVLKGVAKVFQGGASAEVPAGAHMLIPKNTLHSVENAGGGELEYYYILPNKD